MKCVQLLICICIIMAVCKAQTPDNTFIIASCWGPPMSGDAATDQTRLRELSDLGFNTLSYYYNFDNSLTRNSYKLARAAEVGLRVMLSDTRFNNNNNIHNLATDIINEYNALPQASRNAIYCWLLRDEPPASDWQICRTWCQELNSLNNIIPPYVNFAEHPTSLDLRTNFFDNNSTPFVSLDTYTFYNNFTNYTTNPPSNPRTGKGETGIRMRLNFFRNYRVMAEIADATNRRLIAYPLTAMHSMSVGTVIYDDRTESTFRFGISAPLIYGAKGLIYYTYASMASNQITGAMPTPPCDILNPAPECYHNSILEDNSANGLKSWVRTVNQELSSLSAFIMGWHRLATVHGTATNNYYCNYNTTSGDGWGNALALPESGLEVITSSTPIMQSFTGTPAEDFAFGLFEDPNFQYIVIMNKNVEASRSVTINLKRHYESFLRDKTNSRWTRLAGLRRQIKVNNISPGDFAIVQLKAGSHTKTGY